MRLDVAGRPAREGVEQYERACRRTFRSLGKDPRHRPREAAADLGFDALESVSLPCVERHGAGLDSSCFLEQPPPLLECCGR